FFASRRRHTRSKRDWSSDVCSSDLHPELKFHTSTSSIIMPKEAKKLHAEVEQIIEEMLEDGTFKEISETFFDGQDVSVEPEEDRSEERRVGKEGRTWRSATQ